MDIEVILSTPVLESPELEKLLEQAKDLNDDEILHRLSSMISDSPSEAEIISLWKRLFQKPDQVWPDPTVRPARNPPHQDQDGSLPVVQVFWSEFLRHRELSMNKLYRWSLDVATKLDHPKTVEYLLDTVRANPKGNISPYMSPLCCAAAHGNLEIARLLIAHPKTRVNPRDAVKNGSPLHFATAHNHPEMVGLLIAAGADVNALYEGPQYERAETAPLIALRIGAEAAAEELLKHSPQVNLCVVRASELWWAVHRGQEGLVRKLPDVGANPALHNGKNLRCPLLSGCVGQSQIGILKMMLLYNLDLDDRDKSDNTLLHDIHAETTVETVRLLVRRGYGVNVLNDNGVSPLSNALLHRNLDVAKYLVLEAGADVNAHGSRTRHGSSLHIACVTPGIGLEMVKLLVGHGANVNDNSAQREGTPFHALCVARMESGDEDAERDLKIQYLLDRDDFDVNARGIWDSPILTIACLTGLGLDVIKSLITRDARVDSRDDMGRQPIHAVTHRDLSFLECLVEAGAKLDTEDKMGRNLLHMAASYGRLDVIKYVLKHNKDLVNKVDNHRWTPLLWAVRGGSSWGADHDFIPDQQAIIEELLGCGATRVPTGKGLDSTWTALRLARYHGASDDIIRLVTPTAEELGFLNNDESADSKSSKYFCEGCLLAIQGKRYMCGHESCRDFALCFKCSLSQKETHPDHQLRPEPSVNPGTDKTVATDRVSNDDDSDDYYI